MAANQAVQVAVGAETDGYVSAIDEASRTTSGFKSRLATLSGVLVGGAAAVGIGVAAALGKSAQAAAGFEEAMIEVEKVTSPETAAAMNDEIQQMAEEIPMAQNQLAQLAADAGRFGIEGTDNIEQFTRSTAKMAEATNLNAQTAGESLARLSELTNTPIDQVENLGSSINALSNNFATSAQEIVDSMLRSSAALSNLGLNQREIAGLSAALNEVSESSERAGTRLRRLGQELLDPKTSKEVASALGQTTEEFRAMVEENPRDALVRMAEAMQEGGKTADGLRSALSTTSQQALAALGQNLDGVRQSQEMANESFEKGTSLQEEFEAANSTFNAQLQRFKNELRNVGIEIGEEVLPYLSDFLTTLSGGVEDLETFVTQSGDLQSEIERVGEGFETAGSTAQQAIQGNWSRAFGQLESTHESALDGLSTALVGQGGSGGPLNEMVTRGSDYLQNNAPSVLEEGATATVQGAATSLGNIKHILIGPDGESGVLSTMVDEGIEWLKETGPELAAEGGEALGEGIRWGLKDLSKLLVEGEDSVIWSNIKDVKDWALNNGWDLMVSAGQGLVDAIIAGFGGLVRGLVGAEDGEIPNAIDNIVAELEDAPGDFKSAITGWGAAIGSDLKSAINDALNLPFKVGPIKVEGHTVLDQEKTVIPALAQGGIVTEPTMAMVGEGSQSEAVVPLDKLERMLSGGMGGTQQVEVLIRSDDEKFEAEVREISGDEFEQKGEQTYDTARRLGQRGA